MCGIAGIVGSGDHQRSVERMVSALHHRGPDDNGVAGLGSVNGGATFGSSRLAILDLSPSGHMPMTDADTGNAVVYNGEVYNFREIRQELEACGARFSSGTDTEVILRAYKRWGPRCVDRLRGMFAVAVWDQQRQEVFLARDRVGEKPLYFTEAASGRFVFASEVRALLDSGLVERRLDREAVDSFLFNGFVVSPLTLIKGVRSLMPGHWMRVNAHGEILEVQRYWQLPAAPEAATRVPELIEEVRARLDESVRMRLISDVPLGAFLSGGLDSSAIVALMARSGSDVRTFAVTFDDARYDESTASRWVAQRFATTHTEVRLRQQEFQAWLPDALAALDQPSFDGINTYFVARAAKESGLTVALSGAGSDEVFGGYPFFKTVPWLSRVARMTQHLPAPVAQLSRKLLQGPRSRVAGPLKSLELLDAGTSSSEDRATLASYQTAQMLFPAPIRHQLLSGNGQLPDEQPWFGLPHGFRQWIDDEQVAPDVNSVLSKASLRLFLGERCLRDIDTMSMGVSLEIRAPFTDHLFLESIWKVPADIRCAGAPNKPFEWEVVRPLLGADFPLRAKQGFIFPFEEWLRDSRFSEQLWSTLSNTALVERCGLRPAAISAMMQAFTQAQPTLPWSRIWSLFVLLNWCERHGVTT